MKRFHSYGPVDLSAHYGVPRTALVQACVDQLVGDPVEGGHFFTIWGPRQTGKTWLMRRAISEIRAHHGDRLLIGYFSMQGLVVGDNEDPEAAFLRYVPNQLRDGFGIKVPVPPDMAGWMQLFHRGEGVFDRPVILLIDEFDSLPPRLIDRLVTLFRDVYLRRESHWLSGLALIGVRAVLGVDSPRGSPFNIQRSLHVPNLTQDEVREMFRQYQEERGQAVDPAVVDRIYEVTRGQPGLVGWFGELLTEKYNPGKDQPITQAAWDDTYLAACRIEFNNTVLNLLKKARGGHRDRVIELFSRADVPFSPDEEWCSYLYLNGVIDYQKTRDPKGEATYVCRFSSPFIQLRLYNALAADLCGDRMPILALEPLDDLADVFTAAGLDVPALLARYRAYLIRLRGTGQDPWKEQPRRADLHLRESVGHFHLYAWLRDAIGRRCVVSPEFPTGNGKVDLLLRWEGRTAVLEVKSFKDLYEVPRWREQAARYARGQGLDRATLALFVPSEDETVLQKLSSRERIDAVEVTTVASGWT